MLEKELKSLETKKERISKAYINGSFTLDVHDKEIALVDSNIEKIQKQILEKDQASNLNLTIDDILLKRDMDFINRIKLPMLYDKFVETWNDLEREEKANIVMNYIDDIELNAIGKTYEVKTVNFRTTFYTEFKKLFDEGYIDWKIPIQYGPVTTQVRYSEYLPMTKVMENLYRLNECYEVSLYKSDFNLTIGAFDGLAPNETSIVRMFPTAKKVEGQELIGMAMIYTKNNADDIKVENEEELFYTIPPDVSVLK